MSGTGGEFDSTPSVNIPVSKSGNSGWFIYDDSDNLADVFPITKTRHNFRIGEIVTGTWPAGKMLKPAEMWNIDTKLDDGKPAMGLITTTLSSYVLSPDCVTSDIANTAEYEISISTKECFLFADAGF